MNDMFEPVITIQEYLIQMKNHVIEEEEEHFMGG